MAETVAQLRALSDEEVIAQHDARAEFTDMGPEYYIWELHRRDQERQTSEMLRLTNRITIMTLGVTLATFVNLGIAVAYFVLKV